jgi:hypothetical protein
MQNAALHLDTVARQTHDPLDVVGGGVLGQSENNDIAIGRLRPENTARELDQIKGKEYWL